jgi:prepilin-type N-terminal cleavage/methylation domain-containing protein
MKKAFTLIELVIVIVVVGILAAAIIPRLRTNPVSEASIDLLSKIRYTQHLSMVDDKYNASTTSWYKNRWQLVINNNSYSIVSDDNITYALNPFDKISTIEKIKLKGVSSITLSGGCDGKNIISFDYLGRPLIGSLSDTTSAYTVAGNNGELLTEICDINLTNGSKTVSIHIAPETGYTSIQ